MIHQEKQYVTVLFGALSEINSFYLLKLSTYLFISEIKRNL